MLHQVCESLALLPRGGARERVTSSVKARSRLCGLRLTGSPVTMTNPIAVPNVGFQPGVATVGLPFRTGLIRLPWQE